MPTGHWPAKTHADSFSLVDGKQTKAMQKYYCAPYGTQNKKRSRGADSDGTQFGKEDSFVTATVDTVERFYSAGAWRANAAANDVIRRPATSMAVMRAFGFCDATRLLRRLLKLLLLLTMLPAAAAQMTMATVMTLINAVNWKGYAVDGGR
jgi:hypothetical protein